MSKPPIAVLFDMDGVLIDTVRYQEESRPGVVARFGFNLAEERAASANAATLVGYYRELQKIRSFDVPFEAFADIILEGLFADMEADGVTPDPELTVFLHDIRKQARRL